MRAWQTAVCRLYHGHPTRGGSAQGSACFVTPDRLLTAAHLVRDLAPEQVYLRGLPADAVERVVETRCHPTLDLAWLRIGAPQPVRPMRLDPRPLPDGAELTLCGFPDPDSGLRTARHRLIARDGGFQLGIVQGYPGKGFSGGPALLGAGGTGWAGALARLWPWLAEPRLAGICAARHQDRNEGLIVPLAAAPELLAELPPARPPRRRKLVVALVALAAAGIGWRLLSEATEPLAGSIRDADGEPIAGVAVTLTEYDLTATTDHLGRFRFQVPTDPGTMVELVASSPGHRGWR
ncbi:MAG: carboxypeptidase regulatory-like domain-containing protein, partial [Thiohalocapsa sp.]